MLEHTYLRYECADAFGLITGDAGGSIIIADDDTNNTVWTTAGSHVLGWNPITCTLTHKVAPADVSSNVGTGQALTGEHVTALDILSTGGTGTKLMATGWNTGIVRIFEVPTKGTSTGSSNNTLAHSLLLQSSNDDILPEPLVVLDGHEHSAISFLKFDTKTDRLASGSSNGTIVVWDVVAETGLFRLLGHVGGGISGLAFFDENYLLSTCLDGLCKVWDLEGQCCTQTMANHNGQVWSGTILTSSGNDGDETTTTRTRFLTGSVNGQVKVWNVQLPKRLQQQDGNDDDDDMKDDNTNDDDKTNNNNNKDVVCHAMGSLVVPPNVVTSSERIVSIQTLAQKYVGVLHHNSKSIQVYILRSATDALRKKQRRLKRKREKNNNNTKEANADAVASTKKRGMLDDDTEVVANDATPETLEEANVMKASDEFEYHGTIHASHKIRNFCLLTSSTKGIKVVCGLSTNALEVHVLKKKNNIVESEKLSIMDMYGHPTGIRSVALSSDDALCCTVSKNVFKIWNTAKRSCVSSLTPTTTSNNKQSSSCYGLCVSFLPGNTHCVLGTREGYLLLLDIASGDVVFCDQEAHDGAIWSLHVTRNTELDEIHIVTGSADKHVKFWVVEEEESGHTPMLVHTRTLQMSDDVVAVRYSHDATKRLVFVSTLDSTIKVFFDDSLKFFLSLYGHKLPALAVDASDDDVLLASSGADKTIKLWGLDFGDTHRTLYGHEDSVTDLRFVPRTHHFFTCSKDGTVRYWDADRFEQILLLQGHFMEINTLAMSRTGAFVLTGGMDRQVRVWERTKDMVFLQEERERDLEQVFDKVGGQNNNDNGGTFGILNRKQKDGDDNDDDEEDDDEQQPQSAAAVRKSVLSVASGDRIMEALERADQELKDIAAFKRSTTETKKRMPNALLLGMEPSVYMLWVLRTISSSELEQSLMVLSLRHMERLVYYLIALLRAGRGVELCSRVAVFMVTTHQKQIVATHSLMVTPLRELRRLVRLRLRESRDVVGFNLAALRSIAKVAHDQKASKTFDDNTRTENIWAGMGLGSEVAAALERGK